MSSSNTPNSHRWSFVRLGGFDQVLLDDAESIGAIATLDQKLWGALASPVKGTYLDERTMHLIDTDDDGRIRAPEIIEAVGWISLVLRDVGELTLRADGLPLSSIREDTELGKRVLASAHRLQAAEQKTEAVISVKDTTVAASALHALPFNGDGVITIKTIATHAEEHAAPPHAEDGDDALAQKQDTLRAVFEAILDTLGSVPDRSGEPGIDAALIETFYEAASEYESWWSAAEARENQSGHDVIPLGDGTARAVEAYERVRAKIDDYFLRCELVAFDPRSQPHLVGHESQWSKLSEQLLSDDTVSVEEFPLAMIAPDKPLPLDSGINPGWRDEIAAFKKAVVEPMCGKDIDELSRDGWEELEKRFEPYTSWLANKRGVAVEKLGIARIREILQDPDTRTTLESLVKQDLEVKPEADAIDDVTRAVRYYRDLHALLENFVNFRDFYDPDRLAIFQSGVLYLDGRSCELCIDVDTPDTHVTMAQRSYAYLAYCECRRKDHDGKRYIVAAFTDGDNDFLIKGRNGVFYDRDGRDWDARITQIVEQPISIRQAFWSPYKRLFRFVSTQIETFTAERDAQTQKQLDSGVSQAQKSLVSSTATSSTPSSSSSSSAPAPSPKAADPKPSTTPSYASSSASGFDIAKYAGIFAAIGLAAGFIISSVTLLVTAFFELAPWQMPLVILGIIIVISGPSMLLAAFKLHQRHLAPLLDANGWAVNTRARLNIPFGAALTDVGKLPKGAHHSAIDPYREKNIWPRVAILIGLALGALLTWWLFSQGIVETPAWLESLSPAK